MDIVVGTAGHIDHGKTALVKALTGIDADRLPEEKRRGITIDLGFAEMSVGDVHFGFVDVPGHERFVRNMLAGASGIDLVLLVVAADEGVMPQTREHFEICRLLGLKHGAIALTKSDLADEETLELARLDVAELVAGSFLENAPVVVVSSRTRAGVDELEQTLAGAAGTGREANRFTTFLPVDRSFSIKGFGTVVTGTLASGEIADADELVLLPNGIDVRVRGVQSHGHSEPKVSAGRRTAVNLAGVDHDQVTRGMVLTRRGVLHSTQLLDSEIEMLASAPRPLRSRQRVRVHIGTAEVLARVQVLNAAAAEIAQGGKDLVQLRLETPVVAIPGQRVILRSYSPQFTIGGGTILDTAPEKHRRRDVPVARDFLQSIGASMEDDARWILTLIENSDRTGMTKAQLCSRTGLLHERIEHALAKLSHENTVADLGGAFVAKKAFAGLRRDILSHLHAFHASDPLAKGMTREALAEKLGRIAAAALTGALDALRSEGQVAADADAVRLASHVTELNGEDAVVNDRLLRVYNDAKLEVPRTDEALASAIAGTKVDGKHAQKLLRMLVRRGEILRVTDEFHFSSVAIDEAIATLRSYAAKSPDRMIDVPKFKELTGVSRKYAIPLLQHFDAERITRRVGDKRVVI